MESRKHRKPPPGVNAVYVQSKKRAGKFEPRAKNIPKTRDKPETGERQKLLKKQREGGGKRKKIDVILSDAYLRCKRTPGFPSACHPR